MTKVKVCGITNLEDARVAIEAGADYVGLIFANSKRNVIKETAQKIVRAFPDFNNFVGVFLDGKKREVEKICSFTGINIVQFHGSESPAFCNYFTKRGIEVIKVFRVHGFESFQGIEKYDRVHSFLFDTYVNGVEGGTGVTFDWTMTKDVSFLADKNVFIGGGLNPDNVCSVIDAVSPYAVDASSGLELKPGIKDHCCLRQFINNVRSRA